MAIGLGVAAAAAAQPAPPAPPASASAPASAAVQALPVAPASPVAPTSPLAPASPAASPWGVDYSSERADVTSSGVPATWAVDRAQLSWVRADEGGWFASVERDERYGLTDVSFAARGYRRSGDWTVLVGASAAPGAEFLPRVSFESELSRRIAGSVVASAAYHFLQFPATPIHQAQPALTWYHARGQVEGRFFLTYNPLRDGTSTALLIHATQLLAPRLRLDAGAAYGDRIFDVASLPFGTAPSATAFARVGIGFTKHDFIVIGVTGAHEQPAFDYRSLTLGYQRRF
jgi:YaiO family outer membrane protein